MSDRPHRAPSDAIHTFTGLRVRPVGLQATDVRIQDIAHALANLCRFGGHTREFYSVAQHSVLVSELVPPADALAGLLHDAAEAYIGDVVTPLKGKAGMTSYRALEEALLGRLFAALQVSAPVPETVWEADRLALAAEMRDLITDPDPAYLAAAHAVPTITPWPPAVAKANFWARYHALTRPAEVA